MKELLSHIGIEAATVDTILPAESLTAGDPVTATVTVEGGSTDQDVDAIYFALCTEYLTEESRKRGVLTKAILRESFTIEAGERRSFETEIQIPSETPVTVGRTKVWVETGLDVDRALDPDDTDHVEVQPSPRVAAVMGAMVSLGFHLRTAEPVRSKHGLFTTGPEFVQEIEYIPTSGDFEGRIDVHLEVDKRVVCSRRHSTSTNDSTAST